MWEYNPTSNLILITRSGQKSTGYNIHVEFLEPLFVFNLRL